MKKTLILSGVAAVLALTLSGCGVLTDPYKDQKRDGGQTPEQAISQIENIEGVTSASFISQRWYSPGEGGLFSSEGMNPILEVTIDPSYHIADPDAFVDYTTSLLWSVNDKYPKGNGKVVITGGVSPNFDWNPATEAVFGQKNLLNDDYLEIYSDNPIDYTEKSAILLPVSAFGKKIGKWPSTPPTVPQNLLEEGAPEIILPSAIINVSNRNYTVKSSSTRECWVANFDRNVTSDGTPYEGVISAGLYSGDSLLDTKTPELKDDFASFCYPKGEREEDNLSILLITEPQEGFKEINVVLYF